jgi:hypothetical protein
MKTIKSEDNCGECRLWKIKCIRHSKTRREAWVHKASFTLPLFIEVPVPSLESKRSCICVLGVSIFFIFNSDGYPDQGFQYGDAKTNTELGQILNNKFNPKYDRDLEDSSKIIF